MYTDSNEGRQYLMKKMVSKVNFLYTYDGNRKGAKYTIDGVHYMNGGDFAEIADKSVRGLDANKDANTPYDAGSDIPELNTSVKSSKFTLTSCVLGSSFDEVVNRYFETVHSTSWDYVVIIDDEVIIYTMNAVEFRSFLNEFASYANDRKVVRGKATSGKMIAWFEERVEG